MKITYRLFSMLFIACFLFSCTEELDFSQTDAIEITPTIEASVFYFETTETLINETPGALYDDVLNIDAFNSGFLSNKLLEGSLTYQIENTTSKPIAVLIELLDDAGAVLDTVILNIDAEATNTINKEVFYGGTSSKPIAIINSMSGIRLTATNLGDSTSVSSLPNPKFIFRSSAKFKVDLR